MVNKQKRYCAILAVEINSEDYFKAQQKIEELNDKCFKTYHGDSNILGIFEEAL